MVERLIATVPVYAGSSRRCPPTERAPTFSIARENGLATLSHGARLSRIGSVERVINVAGRRSQLKFITARNRAAVLAELRCVLENWIFWLAIWLITMSRRRGTQVLST